MAVCFPNSAPAGEQIIKQLRKPVYMVFLDAVIKSLAMCRLRTRVSSAPLARSHNITNEKQGILSLCRHNRGREAVIYGFGLAGWG